MYKVVPWNPNRMQTCFAQYAGCPSRDVNIIYGQFQNGRNLKTKTPNG